MLKWQRTNSLPPCLVSVLNKHKTAFKSSFLQTMQLFAFFWGRKNLFPREEITIQTVNKANLSNLMRLEHFRILAAGYLQGSSNDLNPALVSRAKSFFFFLPIDDGSEASMKAVSGFCPTLLVRSPHHKSYHHWQHSTDQPARGNINLISRDDAL